MCDLTFYASEREWDSLWPQHYHGRWQAVCREFHPDGAENRAKTKKRVHSTRLNTPFKKAGWTGALGRRRWWEHT